MLRLILLLTTLAVAACGTGPTANNKAERRANATMVDLPPMKHFGSNRIAGPNRSNHDIANDFLDLSFQMESGRKLPIMTRFEGPISLRVTGHAPSSLHPDLNALLKRLKTEAGIKITRVTPGQDANITIEAISRAKLQKLVPHAACFVVPNVSSWADYRRLRRSSAINWSDLKIRQKVAIFLPNDVSPQEVRDCLHEELAQALGPLNDLYRLSDSVFNDDNFHTVLTGFDMLILRAYYSPQMHNGMSRAQAAAVLPKLLARLNPRGQRLSSAQITSPTPRSWINAIETALGAKASAAKRRSAANKAVSIAQANGWNDTRLGFSLYALGRLSLSSKSDDALAAFLSSGLVFKSGRETQIQSAHVAMQLSAFALAAGDGQTALMLTNKHLPAVAAAENASLLATLLLIKAEALGLTGRASEAHQVRLDGLGWARYGFGSDKIVRRRLTEIKALTPKRPIHKTANL